MLFVFDENFSKNLAAGLDLLEKSNPASKIAVDVTSAEVFMGKRGADDPVLYEAVGKVGGVVITKDKDFKQVKLLDSVIEQHKAKVLFFRSSKKLILFWDILIAMIENWEEIKEKLSNDAPPYVYEFDIRAGISPRHL
jgi:predicted nuclease of predicted toxin-antitoxin system